jgi:hypothetical protein
MRRDRAFDAVQAAFGCVRGLRVAKVCDKVLASGCIRNQHAEVLAFGHGL